MQLYYCVHICVPKQTSFTRAQHCAGNLKCIAPISDPCTNGVDNILYQGIDIFRFNIDNLFITPIEVCYLKADFHLWFVTYYPQTIQGDQFIRLVQDDQTSFPINVADDSGGAICGVNTGILHRLEPIDYIF